jgi:hypothetical protein
MSPNRVAMTSPSTWPRLFSPDALGAGGDEARPTGLGRDDPFKDEDAGVLGPGVLRTTAMGRPDADGPSAVLKLNRRTSPRTVATTVATARRGGSASEAGLGLG